MREANAMTETIHVLHVLGRLDRGGAETMVMNLYRAIDRSIIQFDFLVHTDKACDYDEEIRRLGGQIYRAPRYNIINHLAYCRWLDTFFKSHPEYHIVHGHQYNTASIYLQRAKKHGRVTIAHGHSTSGGKSAAALGKRLFQLRLPYVADYLLACSVQSGEWLYRGIRPFDVIPNAIHSKLYCFSEETRTKVRKLFGIKEEEIVIGHVGRFCAVKNHGMLIDIFHCLHKACPNSRLLLVGDGELRESVEKKASLLSLRDNVIFAGVRADVNEVLQAMDVFVYPSLYEGLPVTLIEAQASGLPCLISDNITTQVDITNQIYRMPVQKTPESWAEKALSLLPPAQRKDMSAQIKKAGFDIGDLASRMTQFYLDLHDKHASMPARQYHAI